MKFLYDQRQRARSAAVRPAWVAAALATALALTAGAAAATPTPVLLGTTDPFAVLAGSGITNIGTTIIVGDVGSSPTPTQSGFAACPGANCVALTGANHTTNDTVTQVAKTDLTTAYNNAAGQTPTQVPTELAGQTLTGGVYTAASGTFGMTGTLVLDGQNNPDTIFIFQTATTLITGGTGNVSMIRGAQACNVFWKVGTAATLGAGSTLLGTVLAHDDISLGDGVTVLGRLLAGEQASGAGAVTLNHDTITRPSTCLTAAPATTTPPTTTTTTTTPATGAKSTPLTPNAAADAAKKLAAKKLAAKKLAAKKLAARKAAAQRGGSTTITQATPKRPIHRFGLTG